MYHTSSFFIPHNEKSSLVTEGNLEAAGLIYFAFSFNSAATEAKTEDRQSCWHGNRQAKLT